VLTGYESGGPIDLVVDSAPTIGTHIWRWRRDGSGNERAEIDDDPLDALPGFSFLKTGGRMYEEDGKGPGVWRDWGPNFGSRRPTMMLPAGCGIGWSYHGDDLVLGRPAAHLVCGFQEFWIDREWLLVTRAHDHDPLLGDDPAVGLSQVISVNFDPQPAELFSPPPPDEIWP
jgi:hypothetical protein